MTLTYLRPRAENDLVERTRHDRREGGEELGRRCFEAAVAALDAIGRMPGAGRPLVGELVEIPGLRHRRVAGFPCGWFFFVADGGADVVRLLADAQNLLAILVDAERE